MGKYSSIGRPGGGGGAGGGGSPDPWAIQIQLINTNKTEANILLFCIVIWSNVQKR